MFDPADVIESLDPSEMIGGGGDVMRPTEDGTPSAIGSLPPGANPEMPAAALDLYWIPLGAGARIVRFSGWAFERLAAFGQRRSRRDLYHSALIATTPAGRTVIEMTPIPDGDGTRLRGVIAEGPVGTGWARPFRVFRYEIRCWQGGTIPDIGFAVASPVRVTDDPTLVTRVLELVAQVPTPVWGRDELRAGEMWNSNSVISWVLSRAGLASNAGAPPNNGRAPGWDAGVRVAECTADSIADSTRRPIGGTPANSAAWPPSAGSDPSERWRSSSKRRPASHTR